MIGALQVEPRLALLVTGVSGGPRDVHALHRRACTTERGLREVRVEVRDLAGLPTSVGGSSATLRQLGRMLGERNLAIGVKRLVERERDLEIELAELRVGIAGRLDCHHRAPRARADAAAIGATVRDPARCEPPHRSGGCP